MITNQAITKEITRTEHGIYLHAQCGKVSAFVCITQYGYQVVCNNSSHRAWKRGLGRLFANAQDAILAYKSDEMKAIIALADSLNA